MIRMKHKKFQRYNFAKLLGNTVALRIQPILVELLFIMRGSFRLNSVFGSTTKCMDLDPKNIHVMVRNVSGPLNTALKRRLETMREDENKNVTTE